jgi:thiol-disulfide isomerase/thioredoxin
MRFAGAVIGLGLLAACGASESTTVAADGEAAAQGAVVTTAASSDPVPATVPTANPITSMIGRALAVYDASQADGSVGAKAPVASGLDLITGNEVEIAVDGRPMVIGFYAHWCPHCQAEVAALTTWLETQSLPTGIDFKAVSTFMDEDRDNFSPDKWLSREGWEHPIISDTDAFEVAEIFGVPSIPFYIFVNADGTVAARSGGNLEPAALAANMNELLAAQP